jgi:hypothetical protein
VALQKLTVSLLSIKVPSILQNFPPPTKPTLRCPIGRYRDLCVTVALLRRLNPAISIVAPHERLSLIARHLDLKPPLPLNTPYSIDPALSVVNPAPQRRRLSSRSPTHKMSSQPDHPTLLIPGPIEFDDAVLQSMGHFRYEFNILAFPFNLSLT